jgi:putative DNA primase/helicase
MGGDNDPERAKRLVAYLQIAFGYSLTGHTSGKAVFFAVGIGDTGKSTMLHTVRECIPEYSTLIQSETLFSKWESSNAMADLADLRGARFAMTSEVDEGVRLREAKLKRITQGIGQIKATRKYENPIEASTRS